MVRREVIDPDVRLLAAIAGTLKGDYVREGAGDPWEGSPFKWIKARPSSRQVGTIGERLVTGWCEAKGLDVVASGDSEADRVIAGRRVEVKFSTLWQSGDYKFQQIRDQDYDFVLCLGLSPFSAHCWVISKAVLRRHVIQHKPQHAGRRGTDTFWFHVDPDAPPEWLRPFGGTLAAAYAIMRQWQANR